jgi:hypothetical protein
MDEEMTAVPYETPALVELGEFGEDTLGYGTGEYDFTTEFGY